MVRLPVLHRITGPTVLCAHYGLNFLYDEGLDSERGGGEGLRCVGEVVKVIQVRVSPVSVQSVCHPAQPAQRREPRDDGLPRWAQLFVNGGGGEGCFFAWLLHRYPDWREGVAPR